MYSIIVTPPSFLCKVPVSRSKALWNSLTFAVKISPFVWDNFPTGS